ncbi:SDR family oxidoreductase [Prosthecomicrobium pneumaticum]|uniref:NAD(P)-dependent dehydrogenase (Short-subunit alcohol dehydrogenase family) n=1 Tax=Prosthecomicrobium pneumaticum TaxID=81895 RepID=A0A7W9FL56_9HYPH|nr:SDR family oxidoreductase [Prosthecomicrobium pneumaticum]MBB5752234.1 NAD(P)-dependent dehydrogenase (short-subunit alcohol dehydrogenase family) [Prosthecomicrobium pneumaticum]
MQLSGKRAVVTGAGGGIGTTLVEVFKAAGAEVVACDRTNGDLEGTAADHAVTFDLLDADSASAAGGRIAEAFGTPDILVNNAGWTRAETLDHLDEASITREVELNLTGVMRFTQALLPSMVAAQSGAIVFVSSVNGLIHFGNPAYAAAKAGILAYSRGIAVEYGRHGLRSNAVCPGSVMTAAWEHRIARDPSIADKILRLYPLGRLVSPVDVAKACLFLASPAAAGITGVALPVDAGLTAGNLPFIHDVLQG